MEAKRARLRKLSDATSVQGVSMSALRTVLAALEAENVSRKQLANAYHDRFSEVGRSEYIGDFKWEYADPADLLRITLEESPALQEAYCQSLEKYPCSEANPWHMIVAYDEFTPGDKLKTHNRRKTMDVIFNFAELGANMLSLTCTWLLPVSIRHEQFDNIEGGWSRVFCLIMRKLFMGPENFASTGVAVTIFGQHRLIYAKLHWLISDGDGHRMTFCWKGASGLRPCLVHSNILKKECAALETLGPDYVDITCCEPGRFKRKSARQFAVGAEKVRRAHERYNTFDGVRRGITKALLENIETAEGFTYKPHGVPWDIELARSCDMFGAILMDWAHSALQDGTLSVECVLLLGATSAIGKTHKSVEAFLKRPDWQFPKRMRSSCKQLHRVFSDWRLDSEGNMTKVRCTMSELLTLYGLVRNFVRVEIGDAHDNIKPYLDSFYACCKVVDSFLNLKRRLTITADLIDETERHISEHMQLHIAAYGSAFIKPKHHWLYDVVVKLREDLQHFLTYPELAMLFDALVLERSHLPAKDVAENIDNTSRFERSVLAGFLNKQCFRLKTMMPASGALLDAAAAPMPGFPHAHVADSMQCDGKHFSVGDVVRHGIQEAGIVIACAQEDTAFFCIVEALDLCEQITPESATWVKSQSNRSRVWPARSLSPVLAWRQTGDALYFLDR